MLNKQPVDPKTLPYRACVGVMVLNHSGLVWTGHRLPEPQDETEGSDMLWQMPQGGIDEGEEPLAAARRELFEETGMENVSLLGEVQDWLYYDLPPELVGLALKGRYRGQKQKWFAFRFEGHESEIRVNPPPAGNPVEFDCWDWLPMTDLPGLIVPFKRRVYEDVINAFGHLAG